MYRMTHTYAQPCTFPHSILKRATGPTSARSGPTQAAGPSSRLFRASWMGLGSCDRESFQIGANEA